MYDTFFFNIDYSHNQSKYNDQYRHSKSISSREYLILDPGIPNFGFMTCQ